VCDRIPGEAGQAGLPALGALSNGCYDAVAFVNTKLDATLGDGGPILLRVATMTAGIGARVRNAG
jgi:hypothetical protein